MSVEKSRLRVGCAERSVDERIQRLVEDESDEVAWSVVGAGFLPLVAGGLLQHEGASGRVVAWHVGEQPLVNAAEFLAIEVAIVDRSRRAGLFVGDQ